MLFRMYFLLPYSYEGTVESSFKCMEQNLDLTK